MRKTWKRTKGIWVCEAAHCKNCLANGGCRLGKVSLTCDDNECQFNKEIQPGIYGCISMDIHLNAEGKCLLKKEEGR